MLLLHAGRFHVLVRVYPTCGVDVEYAYVGDWKSECDRYLQADKFPSAVETKLLDLDPRISA
jgi:hypothetical protein